MSWKSRAVGSAVNCQIAPAMIASFARFISPLPRPIGRSVGPAGGRTRERDGRTGGPTPDERARECADGRVGGPTDGRAPTPRWNIHVTARLRAHNREYNIPYIWRRGSRSAQFDIAGVIDVARNMKLVKAIFRCLVIEDVTGGVVVSSNNFASRLLEPDNARSM